MSQGGAFSMVSSVLRLVLAAASACSAEVAALPAQNDAIFSAARRAGELGLGELQGLLADIAKVRARGQGKRVQV